MQKLVNLCDDCNIIIKTLNIRDGKELCERCCSNHDVGKQYALNDKNRKYAYTLKGCKKCKGTGYLHKSIYAAGPGYYDEPDPDVFCTCKKGTALSPNTRYDVEVGFDSKDDKDYL